MGVKERRFGLLSRGAARQGAGGCACSGTNSVSTTHSITKVKRCRWTNAFGKLLVLNLCRFEESPVVFFVPWEKAEGGRGGRKSVRLLWRQRGAGDGRGLSYFHFWKSVWNDAGNYTCSNVPCSTAAPFQDACVTEHYAESLLEQAHKRIDISVRRLPGKSHQQEWKRAWQQHCSPLRSRIRFN